MNETESLLKTEDKSDLLSKNKTIYEAGYGEIFWKNFLAGFGRGLGGVFVYIAFLLVIGFVFANFVLPKLMPSINSFMNIFNPVGSVTNPKAGPGNIIPENFDIQKLLGQ